MSGVGQIPKLKQSKIKYYRSVYIGKSIGPEPERLDYLNGYMWF